MARITDFFRPLKPYLFNPIKIGCEKKNKEWFSKKIQRLTKFNKVKEIHLNVNMVNQGGAVEIPRVEPPRQEQQIPREEEPMVIMVNWN